MAQIWTDDSTPDLTVWDVGLTIWDPNPYPDGSTGNVGATTWDGDAANWADLVP